MDTKTVSYNRVSDILECLKSSSDKNFFIEICAFIGYCSKENNYIISFEDNISSDPKNFFCISPAKYLKFKNTYEIIAVFHSHNVGDEEPSEFDIKMSENCCIPFMIFSINSRKFHFYEPQNQQYNVKLATRFKENFL